MQTRQGGAAHVNIFFLLFALLLFAGSVFFLYTMITKQGDVEERLAKIREDVSALEATDLIYKHNIEDVTDAFGIVSVEKPMKVTLEDGTEVDGVEHVPAVYTGKDKIAADTYANQELVGVMLPSRYTEVMKRALSRIGASASDTTLDGAFGAIGKRMETLKKEVEAAEANIQTSITAKIAKDQEVSNAKTQHATAIDGLVSSVEQGLTSYQSQTQQNEAQIERLNSGLRSQQETLHSAINDATANRKRLEAINARYSKHQSALEAVLSQRNPPDAVDGRVLVSEEKIGRAFIDLNRADGLLSGTVFRITNPGSNKVKAYGTVVSVGQDRSEIAIHGLVDRFDPVAGGDELSNDRFTPGMRRTVYLMGTFQDPWDHATVAGILSDLGHDVVRKFDAGVDLVILGDGIGNKPVTETKEFQDASTLGVEFAPVARIRDLLTLRNR